METKISRSAYGTKIFTEQLKIVKVRRYRGSIEVVREKEDDRPNPPEKKEGQKVKYLSQSSLNRMVFTALNTSVQFVSLITLTYSEVYPTSGRDVKGHLNAWLTSYRREYENSSYLWFLEFQARGAPHFHVLSCVEVDNSDREWLAKSWVSATGTMGRQADKMSKVHKHQKSWELIRSRDGARKYVVKYGTKTQQKAVPSKYKDVGRFWGCSRDVSSSAKEVIWESDATDVEARNACVKFGREDVAEWEFVPRHVWALTDDE